MCGIRYEWQWKLIAIGLVATIGINDPSDQDHTRAAAENHDEIERVAEFDLCDARSDRCQRRLNLLEIPVDEGVCVSLGQQERVSYRERDGERKLVCATISKCSAVG